MKFTIKAPEEFAEEAMRIARDFMTEYPEHWSRPTRSQGMSSCVGFVQGGRCYTAWGQPEHIRVIYTAVKT